MKKEDLFKSIGSIDDNLIERSEKIEHKKWYKKTREIAIAACFCICVLGTAFLYLNISNHQSQSSITDNSTNDTEKSNDYARQETLQNDIAENTDEAKRNKQLQERIQELQNGDMLGWIVIEHRIYIQTQDKALEAEDNYQYLGKASDFIGYYQNADSCDGKVYSFSNDRNVIFIKLDNSGIVFLTAEDTTITIENTPIGESSY